MCVCVRERERERERTLNPFLFTICKIEIDVYNQANI